MKLAEEQRSLVRALLRFSGYLNWVYAFALYILSTALTFVSPVVLNLLVSSASQSNPNDQLSYVERWVLAILLLISPIIASVIMSRHITFTTRLGIRMKTALCTMVFHKAMALSSVGKSSTSTGQIVNMMSNDGDQIYRFMSFFAQVWVSPVQILVCMVLIYFQVEYAMFVGLAFMLLLVPINNKLFGTISFLRRSLLRYTDERVKLMNEILSGIKVIKFYGWEK